MYLPHFIDLRRNPMDLSWKLMINVFQTTITGVPCPSPPPPVETCTLTRGGEDTYFGENLRIFGLLKEKNTKKFPPEAKKCILTCSYEKWTAGGEKFSRFARRKCNFLKEIDGFVIKYLKIFPAGLTEFLNKKSLRTQKLSFYPRLFADVP